MAETKRPSAASIIFAPVASDKIFAPMEPTGPGDPDFAGTDAERDEEELTRRELEKELGSIIPLGPDKEFGLTGATRSLFGPAGTLTREGAVMAGALTGQQIGSAVDFVAPTVGKLSKVPVPKVLGKTMPKGRSGEATGATLGAMAGSLFFDSVDDAARYLQAPTGPGIEAVKKFGDALEQSGSEAFASAREGLSLAGEAIMGPDSDAPRQYDSPLGPTLQAAKEGGFEGAIQAALPVAKLLPASVKQGFRKLFGTADPETVELANMAAAYRIPLGIVQGTSHDWLKGFTRVLGVLPFVGTPFRESAKRTDEALGARLYEMMDAFAPSVNTTAQMSRVLVDRAAKEFDTFNVMANRKYQQFIDMTKHLPPDKAAFIPTKSIRDAAQSILDDAAQGTQIMREAVPDSAKRIENLAAGLLNMNKRITPTDFKADLDNLAEIMKDMSPDSKMFKQGVVLKAAYENALSNRAINFAGSFKNGVPVPAKIKDAFGKEIPNPDAVSAKQISNELAKAEKFFNEGLKKFETKTAQKFGKVDKGLFHSTFNKAGVKEKDEIFKDVFNLKSADSLRHLRELVGAKEVHRALGAMVAETLEKSRAVIKENWRRDDITGVLPDAKAMSALENALGLTTRGGRETLGEALKYSGVSVKELQDFFALSRASQSFFIPDASVFLQRRVTLGGLAALTAAGGTISAAGTALLPTAVKLYVMRMGSKALTNPKNLRTMTQALSDEVPDRLRRAAYLRMVKQLSVATKDDPELTAEELDQLKSRAVQAGGSLQEMSRAGEQAFIGNTEALEEGASQAISAIQSSLTPRVRQKIQSAISQ